MWFIQVNHIRLLRSVSIYKFYKRIIWRAIMWDQRIPISYDRPISGQSDSESHIRDHYSGSILLSVIWDIHKEYSKNVRYKRLSSECLIMYDIRGIRSIKENTIWVSHIKDISVSDIGNCYSGMIWGAYKWITTEICLKGLFPKRPNVV